MLDKKRVIIVFFIICFVVLSILGVYHLFIKEDEEKIIEYTPQEEISEEQMRQTIISLYYLNGEQLLPEARMIDVKELIENPYEKILNLLLEGPKNENLKNAIPQGTKINKIEKQGENLIIDFSKEFIENHEGGEEKEKLTIKSIVNTVTELTEINGIKILIDGEENKSFKEEKINFKKIFTRENI